jgi:carbon starvation protein CstA
LVFAVLIVTNLFFGIFFTVVRKNPWNLSVLVYSIMQICLTYKVWNGMRNIERTTYEGFVLLILAVLAGSNHLSTNFRERIWLFLAAIGAYTIFLSSQASAYRDLLGFLF